MEKEKNTEKPQVRKSRKDDFPGGFPPPEVGEEWDEIRKGIESGELDPWDYIRE